MKKHSICIFVILLLIPRVYAQKDLSSDLDALKQAYLDVANKKYSDAYPYFEKMLRKYSKDPMYNYYAGRCLLYLEKNPTNALKYLRFASTKDVNHDIWFYLGLAYLRNYQFQEAFNNFLRFEKVASKAELKKLQVKNYISKAQNGLYLTRYIKEPTVYYKEPALCTNFHTKYKIDNLEGQFIDYFTYFNLKKDSLTQESIMFVPRSIEKHDMLYFSAKNKKRDDYDIYRITRLNDSVWSEPENLGEVINTPFDEKYPYIHSDGLSLYFASEGHYSMGGYDLYKSSWDWETQLWIEPKNLDFPINSPFNDMLFVPSPNKKFALFSSDREGEESKCFVCKIGLNSFEPYIKVKNHSEIIKYANLEVNVTPGKVKNDRESRENYKPDPLEIVKIKTDENFLHKNEYDSLINLAIVYQLKADSLRWMIDDKRLDFNNMDEGSERVVIANVIIEFEREVYTLQKKADSCYEKVRNIEQKNLARSQSTYIDVNNSKTTPKEIANKKENNQKLFVEPVADSLKKSKLESTRPELEGKVNDESNKYGIKVEPQSTYTSNNPIPVNEKLENGIIYMIQLGAYSSEKEPAIFKGLAPLSCIKSKNSSLRKYYSGKFQILAEAEKGLPVVKSKGFDDAYIVAYYNGNSISVKNAIKLESESLKQNDTAVNKESDKSENRIKDLSIIYVLKSKLTLNDSLIVKRVKKNLPDELEIFIEKDKNNLIIKSFSTYEKAYAIKIEIEAIINNEFEIHAYFAENHIPLDQARKITK